MLKEAYLFSRLSNHLVHYNGNSDFKASVLLKTDAKECGCLTVLRRQEIQINPMKSSVGNHHSDKQNNKHFLLDSGQLDSPDSWHFLVIFFTTSKSRGSKSCSFSNSK